jgi:sensor histidine kinase YesM
MKFYKPIDQPTLKKHIFIVVLGAVLGLLVYNFVSTVALANSQTFSETLPNALSILLGVLIAYLVYYITLKLDQFLPWQAQLANRFISGIIVHFVFVYSVVWLLFKFYTNFKSKPINEAVVNANISIKLAIILFILTLIYTVIYFALFSYYSYTKLQIESITYERKQIDLQLKALKAQLSPHFLFNSLNTISSLIYRNPKSAESYIRGLGKIYSYTLKSYYTKFVTLSEELDFVTSYILLLETRYENRFSCNIKLPEEIMATKIPPLTLQMLIENAVKHNQMDTNSPLHIELFYENRQIIVKNNITTKPNKVTSFNIGLKNIEERYALLGNANVLIKKDENFVVKIPIL